MYENYLHPHLLQSVGKEGGTDYLSAYSGADNLLEYQAMSISSARTPLDGASRNPLQCGPINCDSLHDNAGDGMDVVCREGQRIGHAAGVRVDVVPGNDAHDMHYKNVHSQNYFNYDNYIQCLNDSICREDPSSRVEYRQDVNSGVDARYSTLCGDYSGYGHADGLMAYQADNTYCPKENPLSSSPSSSSSAAPKHSCSPSSPNDTLRGRKKGGVEGGGIPDYISSYSTADQLFDYQSTDPPRSTARIDSEKDPTSFSPSTQSRKGARRNRKRSLSEQFLLTCVTTPLDHQNVATSSFKDGLRCGSDGFSKPSVNSIWGGKDVGLIEKRNGIGSGIGSSSGMGPGSGCLGGTIGSRPIFTTSPAAINSSSTGTALESGTVSGTVRRRRRRSGSLDTSSKTATHLYKGVGLRENEPVPWTHSYSKSGVKIPLRRDQPDEPNAVNLQDEGAIEITPRVPKNPPPLSADALSAFSGTSQSEL